MMTIMGLRATDEGNLSKFNIQDLVNGRFVWWTAKATSFAMLLLDNPEYFVRWPTNHLDHE